MSVKQLVENIFNEDISSTEALAYMLLLGKMLENPELEITLDDLNHFLKDSESRKIALTLMLSSAMIFRAGERD